MNTSTQSLADLAKSQPQSGYNGTVTVNRTPVNVQNGVAEFEGQQYFVSSDGEIVVDKERNLVGRIENGEFVPTDENHVDALKQRGYLED